MSDKIIIDLTENLSRVGESVAFEYECDLGDWLLPYPNAKLAKTLVQLSVTYLKPDVRAEGTVTCFVNGYCDRCLTEVSRQIALPFSQIFYKDCAEDEDGYIYSGSKLDATKAICDEIVLGLPVSLLCKTDCKGLCPRCGIDLNEQQCDCEKERENAFSVLKNLKL